MENFQHAETQEEEFEEHRERNVSNLSRPSIEVNRTSLDVPRQFAQIKAEQQVIIEKKKVAHKKKKKLTFEDLKKEIDMEEHLLTLEDLAKRFPECGIDPYDVTSSKGLSSSTAQTRIKMYGENKLKPPKKTPLVLKFLLQFTNFFSVLLLVGSFLCFFAFSIDLVRSVIGMFSFLNLISQNFWEFLGKFYVPYDNLLLGIVLFSVTVITNIFSFLQEFKSEKVMEGFKNLIPPKTKVIREGKMSELPSEKLVIGDIIRLKGGDKIPADIRILFAKDFKVDNSSLTGESEPQKRVSENTDKNPLETKNMAFFGTLASTGEAYGLVVFTGDNTMIGRIAGLASRVGNETTPLHKEINRFILIISGIAIFLGVSFFFIGVLRDAINYGIFGINFLNQIVFTIGIIVANVPEGLLATVTVSLTLTAQRMARKNVLVKHLESVETLGSTTTIASDKTGTLTQNRMTVAHCYFDDSIWNCPTNPAETGNYDTNSPTFQSLLRVASLCNRATFEDSDENEKLSVWKKKTIGDASESALIKFSQPVLEEIYEKTINEYRKNFPELCGIPFNSVNKWQLSIHKQSGEFIIDEKKIETDSRPILVMKGAPERIISLCKFIMIEGKSIPLTDEWRSKFEDAYRTLGSYGERVLGFGLQYYEEEEIPDKWDTDEMNLPRKDLIFIGLMSMIDPPREGVPEAVAKCKSAGIRVVMVTGDTHITAQAIAKQVGIISGKTKDDLAIELNTSAEKIAWDQVDAAVVQGKDIASLSESTWDEILSKKEIVFARTTPQHKLIIVEHCQARGEIVAVTGDGVNDSPALKKANIGIAMGIGGSDVSKEAADMILMDDNFASIVNGVEEGRLIFDNLKKSIAYTLSSNIPEIAPFLTYIVLNIPLPLGTILILCVDLGTDMIPAISLAYESPESDIMNRKPRDAKKDNLVTSRLISFSYFQIGVIQALAGFFTYFCVMAYYGFPIYMLPGLATSYFLPVGSKDLRNVRGEIFTHSQQSDILQEAQSAYLFSIIVVQWADLLICKTRKLSLFQQGMRNMVLNFGLVFETVLILILLYFPGLRYLLTTRPINPLFWFPGIPFSILIFGYDELRKFMMRFGNENSWLFTHTYW